jgi:hypothetical protein
MAVARAGLDVAIENSVAASSQNRFTYPGAGRVKVFVN